MLSRLLLIACVGATCAGAESATSPAPAGAAPWTPSFTTALLGKDRQFVEASGKTYLLITIDEIASGQLDGQDVAFTAKLHRLPGEVFGLYRVDGLVLAANGNALAGKLDGDNVHLAGALRLADGQRVLRVDLASQAPSDAQLLQARLAGIQDDEWDRRLGVVSWCREQVRTAGNGDSWTATADALLSRIIADLAARAGERRDVAMVTRAIDLALNQIKDPGLAARLASAPWIREHGGPSAEVIARRMRGLGFTLYKDQWQPRPQALEKEFEDRFVALGWKDSLGFYQLGRWADDNAEALPRARERSWRCYKAGNLADPSNPDIARELGIQPTAGNAVVNGSGATDAVDFIDPETNLRIPAPAGWKRGRSPGGDLAWIDPASDTSQISVKALHPPVDVQGAWRLLDAEARSRNGFAEAGQIDEVRGDNHVFVLRSTWQEGDQQRYASVTLIDLGPSKPAAVLDAGGLPGDRERLDAAVDAMANVIAVQAPAATQQPFVQPPQPPPPGQPPNP